MVACVKSNGRGKKTWGEFVEHDLCVLSLRKELSNDWLKWKDLIWKKRQTQPSMEKRTLKRSLWLYVNFRLSEINNVTFFTLYYQVQTHHPWWNCYTSTSMELWVWRALLYDLTCCITRNWISCLSLLFPQTSYWRPFWLRQVIHEFVNILIM